MDKLLTKHPIHKYSSYQQFIRNLIQDGISNQGYTFESLNYELYRLNTQIYQELTKELLSTYCYVHTSR